MTNRFVLSQLARAFRTAGSHEDPGTRRRAEVRVRTWEQAIAAMDAGHVVVGSRAPVRGFPPWVTLEVLHGGFASGRAVAEAPIGADEIELAARAGVPARRRLIVGHLLSERGLPQLYALLDSGDYRVEIPEDAALLTIAWLIRAGDRAAALEVLDAISPFVDRFRFVPRRSGGAVAEPGHVRRMTAGQAEQALRARHPSARVEAQREALAVWNPFGDRVLALWLERYRDGLIGPADAPWQTRAVTLAEEYDRLARLHTLCHKHRSPKSNLGILVGSLRSAAGGHRLTARQSGLLRCAVEGCLAKRGRLDSPAHVALRQEQLTTASLPSHQRLAVLAADRLGGLDPEDGIADPQQLAADVCAEEARRTGIPDGTAMPGSVTAVLARAHSAPVEVLLDEGVVPSAEVLAGLAPQITASVVASEYGDQALARLAASCYRAFRRRRSVLLVNLDKQVQLSELPWVRAVGIHRHAPGHEALLTARRLGELALDHFPASVLPNPLIREMTHLLRSAQIDMPLTEELAADIFMDAFSPKFPRAAVQASAVIEGTLYADYYRIDAGALEQLGDDAGGLASGVRRILTPDPQASAFAQLCRQRAGAQEDHWSVARNGTVIEQAQILTTHNLAALVLLGCRPAHSWQDLARESIVGTARLLRVAATQDRPLPTVKNAAFAWRQAVFHLSMAGPEQTEELLADDVLTMLRPTVMAGLLEGLHRTAAGSRRGTDGPFLGWVTGRHPVLDALSGEFARPGR